VANLAGVTTSTDAMATEVGMSTKRLQSSATGLVTAFQALPRNVQVKVGEDGLPKTQQQVDTLAKTLKLNKWEKSVLMWLVDHASPGIKNIRDLINGLHDKSVTVTTNFRQLYQGYVGSGKGDKPSSDPYGAGMFGGKNPADGGTMPRTGLPYADRHPRLLADGEEVVSNRHGQADRGRKALKLINRGHLTDAMLGLADGGTVGMEWSDRYYRAAHATRSSSGVTTVRHIFDVRVTGEMDLAHAKAQIHEQTHRVARAVARDEIEQDNAFWAGRD
jgi:hypothetical protein